MTVTASPYRTVLPLLLLLTACSGDGDGWLGGSDDDEKRLPGNRIAVMAEQVDIQPSPSLAELPVVLPPALSVNIWPQDGGATTSAMQHLKSGVQYKDTDTSRIGRGKSWPSGISAAPVIDNNTVYAMDGRGFVSAHALNDPDDIRWMVPAVDADGKDVLGGGLAVAKKRLYVTTGSGDVVALDAENGWEKWRRSINLPLRAAPRVANGMVYVTTLNNQVFALSADDGRIEWKHQGIAENAGVLGAAVPALLGDRLIVPYSSGEIYALDAKTGRELWRDTLIRVQRTTSSMSLVDIDANPVIADGRVYALGHSGIVASLDLKTGQRIWEQRISGINTPWIAGDFLFVLTSRNQLVCLLARDGRIRWVADIPSQDQPGRWHGPVLVDGHLLITHPSGIVMEISPKDGSVEATHDVPSGIVTAPIIAGESMFLVTDDADLVTVK